MPISAGNKLLFWGMMLMASASFSAPFSKPVPAPFHGFVLGITDGDTIKVEHRSVNYMIRLAYIDAPEIDQDFGLESRRCLQRLVYRKTVFVRPLYYDRYERLVAQIDTDKVDVNTLMIHLGCAWHIFRYSHSELWEEYQQEAKALKKGLWQNPRPIKPSVYRQRHQRFF